MPRFGSLSQEDHQNLQSELDDFSVVHPQLMQFINDKGHDPDVERILEGLTWHSGLLKEKLQQDIPELFLNLQHQLWPGYLRPVPGMTILEATPLSTIHNLPKETGATYHEDGKAPCTFQTCRDLSVLPLRLENIRSDNDDEYSVTLTFSLPSGARLSAIDGLSIYVGNDTQRSYELYFLLSHCVRSGSANVNGVNIPLENLRFTPEGISHNESVLPWPRNAMPAHRLIQEYFCFPNGLLFLTLHHDDQNIFPPRIHGGHFSLTVHFTRSVTSLRLRKESLRVNCVPAINLFLWEGEPVSVTGHKTDYPLQASYRWPEIEIYSVESVESGLRKQQGKNHIYLPFNLFEHERQRENGLEQLYYHVRMTQDTNNYQIRHWLSTKRSDEPLWINQTEYLSVKMLCTNGDKAARIGIGQINHTVDVRGSFIQLSNITRPTLRLPPLLDQTQYWTAISWLSKNYKSLLEPESLKQMLISYHFPAMFNRQAEKTLIKALSGIQDITTRQTERTLPNGMTVRGVESVLYASQTAFGSEGALYLFGTVLAYFFAQSAALNTFHLFTLVNQNNQERYTWPVKVGQHSLI